jgi:type I restriction enzyme M protein
MFMHNVDEFLIVQGDTLDSPKILEDDELKKFDVIMANPPYSVKRWNQAKFSSDPFGRNIYGTPPPGNADYAFQQHIIKSLKPESGRCVVLFPHGVLFRDAESEMRKKMIAEDVVDAVIGLGKNLFYNSSMESCLLVCRKKKPAERKGKIIFIDAKDEIRFERSTAYLKEEHIQKIANAYRNFQEIEGFTKIISNTEVLNENNGNLKIAAYVKPISNNNEESIKNIVTKLKQSQMSYQNSVEQLFEKLNELGV